MKVPNYWDVVVGNQSKHEVILSMKAYLSFPVDRKYRLNLLHTETEW